MKYPIVTVSTVIIPLAVGGSAALAEDYQQMQHQPGKVSPSAGMSQTSARQAGTLQKRADEIAGMKVVNRAGQQVGTVDKVMRSKQNDDLYAVISAGGVFDIGDKDIALPLHELRFKDDKLVLPKSLGSETAIKYLPAWDESQYQQIAESQQLDLKRASFAAFESKGQSGGGQAGGM